MHKYLILFINKKVLLTTTALAFAGSAFAADVAGGVTSAYQKAGEDKGLFTYTYVNVSGSKTASNGLTFGATYTTELGGSATGASTSLGGDKVSAGASESGNSLSKASTNTNAKVNAFVSSSFGRVDMGKHNGASETHGAHATYVGNGPAWNSTDLTANGDNVNGITYSTPSFNGISAAYSMSPAKNSFKSWGVKYSGNMAGVGVAVGYGTETPAGTNKGANNAWGVKVSKGAFSASYGAGKLKAVNNDNSTKDEKQTRMGVAYSAGKISVGYSEMKTKESTTASRNSKNTLISASYSVASGLTAFVEQYKDGVKNTKTTLVGTVISF